jgi:threonine synthase
VGDEIPEDKLEEIIADTLCFDFPVVEVEKESIPLSYFMVLHGFQGRGRTFMSRLLRYFNKRQKR